MVLKPIWLALLLAVTHCDRDLVELVDECFGPVNAISSPLPKQWLGPHSLNSSMELASIARQVMLGKVDPTDPIINKLDDAKKRIKKIMQEMEDSRRDTYYYAGNKADEITGIMGLQIRMLLDYALKHIEYNVSTDKINSIVSYCDYERHSPKAFLTKIFNELLAPCNRTLTLVDYNRYAETLSILEHAYVPKGTFTLFVKEEFKFREKADVAFNAMVREEIPQTAVDKFLALKEKLHDDPYYERRILINAIRNGTYIEETFCAYHTAFYERGCTKREFEAFIQVVDNILRSIMIGTVLCGAAKHGDDQRRTFFENTISRIEDIQAFQSRAHSTCMDSTFDTCDVSWIKEAMNNFKPEGKIEEADYQRLANETIDFLMFKGNRERQMHIVVSQNHDFDTNYLPICPKQQCKIVTNSLRNVTIFYTVHDTLDVRQIERNVDHLADSSKEINSIVRDYSGAAKIETIRKELNSRNLTLSGKGRFERELWLRHWTRIGDCQFKTALATNSESKNYELKQFYVRNLLRFSACENYFVYVFP